MQIAQLLVVSTAALATGAAAKSKFPSSVTQQGILNIQNYINNVINDIVQCNTDQIANDYSSTGRSLAFLSQDILPGQGCPQTTTGRVAKSKDQAIADLQKVQLTLSELSLDLIKEDVPKGQKDICRATAEYGDVANYVQMVRTDGK